jgi:hypothetical protein
MDRHVGTGLALAQVDSQPGDVRPLYLDRVCPSPAVYQKGRSPI